MLHHSCFFSVAYPIPDFLEHRQAHNNNEAVSFIQNELGFISRVQRTE